MIIRPARATDPAPLLAIWSRSVRGSHAFLTEADVQSLSPHVGDYLQSAVSRLWVLEDDGGAAIGFMGLSGSEIESLFVVPEAQCQGGGTALLRHAEAIAPPPLTVSVNEQNSAACRFYGARGFVAVGRSETDDAGRPFPLLHLRKAAR